MSLALDPRQRAMLREMGIHLFEQDSPTARAEGVAVTRRPVGRPVAGAGEHIAQLETAVAQPASAAIAAPLIERAPAPMPNAPARPGTSIDALDWDPLAAAATVCRACALCEGRRQTVFGSGDRQADWLIVGDAPGDNEDLQAEPFVGQAGQLLDNMLKALGLNRRQQVYLTNALKCRPPGNRNPEPAEVATCEPYLRRQVELLQPRIILAMGRFAVQSLLQSSEPIGKLRGRVHRYQGVPVVVTFHPAYLLRNLADKARAWTDLCLALEVLQQPERFQAESG
jgi:uracil-DNA glycosylase family 4